jgi:hypothetical protein
MDIGYLGYGYLGYGYLGYGNNKTIPANYKK